MPAAVPIAASVAGGVVSGLMSKGGSKQSGSTTTQAVQSNAPWIGISPYLTGMPSFDSNESSPTYGQWTMGKPGLYPNAADAFNRGAYQGPYITPQSPYSQSAIEGLASQAQDPNSPVAQAQRQLSRTIGGDYLDVGSNPYLSGAVQEALGQAKRGVSQQFSGENYGGSANQEWLGRSLANTALPIYAEAYQKERQNQLNALNLAPNLQQANLSQLLGAGGLQEARGQQEIAAAQQQFYSPWDVLSRYAGILGQIQTPNSGTATQSQPYYTNPWAGMLGGAISGAQLGNQIGGMFSAPQENYGSFVGRAYESGFGPAFTQPNIYG